MPPSIYPLVLGQRCVATTAATDTTPARLSEFAQSAGLDLAPGTPPVDTCWLVGEKELDHIPVVNGAAQGRSLREIVQHNPHQLIGRHHDPDQPFPLSLAIRAIETDQPLSVYPDEETARKLDLAHAMNAKFWYSLAADRNAKIFLGLDPRTSAHQLIQHLDADEARKYLQRFNVRQGDSYLVLPGTVHAVTGGQLMLEMGLSNQSPLRLTNAWNGHDTPQSEIDTAIQSINPESRQIIRMPKVRGPVAHSRKIPLTRHCPFFTVEEIRLLDHIYMATNTDACELLFALAGEFIVEHENGREEVSRGRLCLVPAALGSFKLTTTSRGAAEILRFSRLPM